MASCGSSSAIVKMIALMPLGASRAIFRAGLSALLSSDPRRPTSGPARAHADVVLVVIGPRSSTPALHSGDDHVRLEIEAALKALIPVIPVLVDGANLPPRDHGNESAGNKGGPHASASASGREPLAGLPVACGLVTIFGLGLRPFIMRFPHIKTYHRFYFTMTFPCMCGWREQKYS